MHRLSLIIGEIYRKYLPLAEQGQITLNLDFADSTTTVDEANQLKTELDEHLHSALKRAPRGEVSIKVTREAIVIHDSGTTLSAPARALLSHGRVTVKSRVGFGTDVYISLQPQPTSALPPTSIPPQSESSKAPKASEVPRSSKTPKKSHK